MKRTKERIKDREEKIMICKYCGKELPEGSNFCKHCGKKLVDEVESKAAQDPAQTPAPEAAKVASSTPISDTVKNAMQDKKKKKIIIGVVSAIIVGIAIVICMSIYSDQVPEDLVRTSIKESSSFKGGFVKDDYTNGSNYTLYDVKITGTEKIDNSMLLAWYGGKEGKNVRFKGTIKNDSFESEFTGEATFVKDSNGWKVAGSASKKSSTTKPLKGVDNFELTTSSSSSSSYSSSSSSVTTSSENFKSELKENNGSYTCVASQDCKLQYWFGADTASVKQTFKFNPEKGWEKQGDQEITNQKTEYSLAGKTFEYTSSSILDNASNTLSLTFKNSEKTENPIADYSISHPKGSSASEYEKAVNLSGTANGTINHTFGENSFSIALNDAGQQVTFSGKSSSPKEIDGVGKMNTLFLSVKTNANSYESKYSSSKFSASGTFVETKKQAA